MIKSLKVLLVEGAEDLRVIPELMEANGIDWGTKQSPVVYIREYGGYEKIIALDVISTQLQASGLFALGIIIDADENPLGRWQSIRNASLKSIPNIPEVLPDEGLIHLAPNGVKFGIWVMPDNKMRGMLETFLTYMIPTGNETLWQFAQEAAQSAKKRGAGFTETHLDKANIYTWLAWQEPPGRQLHDSIKQRILNPTDPNAQKFVSWFKSLYDLETG
jgi:hypothetical protein